VNHFRTGFGSGTTWNWSLPNHTKGADIMAATPKQSRRTFARMPRLRFIQKRPQKGTLQELRKMVQRQDAHPDPACFGCINAGKKKGKT
jgi:hypothetical protein